MAIELYLHLWRPSSALDTHPSSLIHALPNEGKDTSRHGQDDKSIDRLPTRAKSLAQCPQTLLRSGHGTYRDPRDGHPYRVTRDLLRLESNRIRRQ